MNRRNFLASAATVAAAPLARPDAPAVAKTQGCGHFFAQSFTAHARTLCGIAKTARDSGCRCCACQTVADAAPTVKGLAESVRRTFGEWPHEGFECAEAFAARGCLTERRNEAAMEKAMVAVWMLRDAAAELAEAHDGDECSTCTELDAWASVLCGSLESHLECDLQAPGKLHQLYCQATGKLPDVKVEEVD